MHDTLHVAAPTVREPKLTGSLEALGSSLPPRRVRGPNPPAQTRTSCPSAPSPALPSPSSPSEDFPEPQGVLGIEGGLDPQEPPVGQVVGGAEGAVGEKGARPLQQLHVASATRAHHLGGEDQAGSGPSACPRPEPEGGVSPAMPLVSSYLVEDSQVRDEPVPGPDVNFQGVAQVGDDELRGQERGRAESEKTAQSLPGTRLRSGEGSVVREKHRRELGGPRTPLTYYCSLITQRNHPLFLFR